MCVLTRYFKEIQMLNNIPISLKLYMLAYSLCLLTSIGLIIKNRVEYNLFTKDYWRFIFTPTKFTIYIIGTLGLIIPVPFLNYHSWDYPIAVFQPILAYLTAPWSIGVLYRMIKGTIKFSEIFIAYCMMLFAGSWSVELYLIFRDGYYMPDWIINIPIGICCYLLVGFLWNIDFKNGKGSFQFNKK